MSFNYHFDNLKETSLSAKLSSWKIQDSAREVNCVDDRSSERRRRATETNDHRRHQESIFHEQQRLDAIDEEAKKKEDQKKRMNAFNKAEAGRSYQNNHAQFFLQRNDKNIPLRGDFFI